MYCSQCGTKAVDEGKFCGSCGSPLAGGSPAPGTSPVAPAQAAVAYQPAPSFEPDSKQKVPVWIRWSFIILVAIGATIFFNSLRNGANPLAGEVSLNVATVEKSIKDGISQQLGITATVKCPNPMSGKAGDTRNCLVTSPDGSNVMAVVTIENSKGDITWKIQ